MTGLDEPRLLRASHIKRWAKCESDTERLDVFNGLLLAPHLDALFDAGWITFDEQGGICVSKALKAEHAVILGVSGKERLWTCNQKHQVYLEWHRKNWFMR